jgi:hypothetical protein
MRKAKISDHSYQNCEITLLIIMIKSRRMRWVGHVARMGRRGMHIDIGGEARRKVATWKTKT